MDKVECQFLGKCSAMPFGIFVGEIGGDANFTGMVVAGVALEGDDVSGLRVVVVGDVELGMFLVGEECDGEFPGWLGGDGQFGKGEEEVLDFILVKLEAFVATVDFNGVVRGSRWGHGNVE